MTRRNDPLRRIQRDSYLISRTAGDLSAARRGVLAKRIVRRTITRSLFQAIRNSK